MCLFDVIPAGALSSVLLRVFSLFVNIGPAHQLHTEPDAEMFAALHVQLHVEASPLVVALVSIYDKGWGILLVVDFLVLSHEGVDHELQVALLSIHIHLGPYFLSFF